MKIFFGLCDIIFLIRNLFFYSVIYTTARAWTWTTARAWTWTAARATSSIITTTSICTFYNQCSWNLLFWNSFYILYLCCDCYRRGWFPLIYIQPYTRLCSGDCRIFWDIITKLPCNFTLINTLSIFCYNGKQTSISCGYSLAILFKLNRFLCGRRFRWILTFCCWLRWIIFLHLTL